MKEFARIWLGNFKMAGNFSLAGRPSWSCPLSLMSEFNECCSVWIGVDKYVIHSFQTEYVHRQVVLRDICVTDVFSNVQ